MNLIDFTDKEARKELGEYLIVSKSRMENLVVCFEGGTARIKELTDIVVSLQEEVELLGTLVAEGNQDASARAATIEEAIAAAKAEFFRDTSTITWARIEQAMRSVIEHERT